MAAANLASGIAGAGIGVGLSAVACEDIGFGRKPNGFRMLRCVVTVSKSNSVTLALFWFVVSAAGLAHTRTSAERRESPE